MLPLRDVLPPRTTPWTTLTLIAANAAVFLWQTVDAPGSWSPVVESAALVPAAFSWTAVISSLFVHQNAVHLAGTLWALWVFSENVEDRMGHGRFLAFYLLAGTAGALAETWVAPGSPFPVLGASGAIAGLFAAYFTLFPHGRVLVLVPSLAWYDLVELPAVLFAAFWWLLQVAGGFGRMILPPDIGRVSLWAHLGGLAAGATLVWLFRRPERQRVEWWGA